MLSICFTTIRNYTTLKRILPLIVSLPRFTTIRNYTTLKLAKSLELLSTGFTTIRNYTTLKRVHSQGTAPRRFYYH